MRIVKPYRYLCLIIACAMMNHLAFTQDLTNQTSIYISPDLDVYFDGNINNEGFLQHQGNFSFTGNWLNTNIFQGDGSILVIGDREQTIDNNRQSFSNLVINGSGNKKIARLLTITDQFQLLSGIVRTTALDTLLLSSSASVSGGSQISFVDGPLFSDGSGYKFFPIGKNGNYNPVEFNDISGSNPMFALEVFENVPEITTPPRANYFPAVYWKRSHVSGTFNGSPITIHFDLPDRFTDSHEVTILQSPSLSQPFTELENVSVVVQNSIDLISSDDLLREDFFVIGSSIPVGGVAGEFYFSSALSPKAAQEENRVIKIFGNKLAPEDFLFQVYNRWGLIVFESKSLQDMIDTGWNGTKSGDFVPAGAYPYILKATLTNGEKFERKGVITVAY